MQLVASGLRYDADLSAGSFSIFGGVCPSKDIELPYRIDPEKVAADPARRHGKLARPGIFNSIQQHDIVAGPAT